MGLKQFASFFGCTPVVASALWNRIDKKKEEIDVPPGFSPSKLLWTLCFLKTYSSETVLSTLCNCTEKTLRKWVWKGIDILGDINLVRTIVLCFFCIAPSHSISMLICFLLLLLLLQIKWENRYMKDNGSLSLVTNDATDFKICEPTPWSEKWYSFKINHAALRYEVGICIQTGWIVWINGPYPPGHWPDLAISRDGLCDALDRDEIFLADGTYADGNGWCDTPTGLINRDQEMKGVARARHETVNGRLKFFGALSHCFRHHRTNHGRVFAAVANVVQAGIQIHGTNFDLLYNDNYNN